MDAVGHHEYRFRLIRPRVDISVVAVRDFASDVRAEAQFRIGSRSLPLVASWHAHAVSPRPVCQRASPKHHGALLLVQRGRIGAAALQPGYVEQAGDAVGVRRQYFACVLAQCLAVALILG